MNPNFDFRDDSLWDDRAFDYSLGDCFLVLADAVGMGLLVGFLGFCIFG